MAAALLWPILAVVILLLLLYYAFDRRRYRGRHDDRQRPTSEIFIDPTTGKRTRVYEDPTTGSRSYREE
ncbi:MAG: hypothetical protein ACRD1C_09090 [Terriglobales bacterium]